MFPIQPKCLKTEVKKINYHRMKAEKNVKLSLITIALIVSNSGRLSRTQIVGQTSWIEES